jgi:hypothetical protein
LIVIQPRWVLVAFGAGLIAGVFVTKLLTPAPGAPASLAASNPQESPAIPAAPTVADAALAVRPAGKATAPAGTNPVPAAPGAPADSALAPPATPGLASLAPTQGVPSPFEPSVDSGTVQAIDVGEVFAKQIARPSRPGEENEIGDAHRALEREARDDAWAYAMEGELQNSMVTQTSSGAFKLEHVECRATMCEVRVSGRADQQAALREWSESLAASGLSQRLFPNMSSSYANNDRVDALYIFRRPRRQP